MSFRLTEFVTIDALPDSALLNVFSYLDAKDLCSVTEVGSNSNISFFLLFYCMLTNRFASDGIG